MLATELWEHWWKTDKTQNPMFGSRESCKSWWNALKQRWTGRMLSQVSELRVYGRFNLRKVSIHIYAAWHLKWFQVIVTTGTPQCTIFPNDLACGMSVTAWKQLVACVSHTGSPRNILFTSEIMKQVEGCWIMGLSCWLSLKSLECWVCWMFDHIKWWLWWESVLNLSQGAFSHVRIQVTPPLQGFETPWND